MCGRARVPSVRGMNEPHPHGLSRRTLLTVGGASVAGVSLSGLLGACSAGGRGSNDDEEGSAGRLLHSEAPLPEPFVARLPRPAVLEPARRDATTDYYEITQKVGRASILPGLATEVWGYDGTLPSPTLVSRRGRRTVVTHRDELPVPVSVHLHGGRTAPQFDGYPLDLIPPPGGEGGAGLNSKEYVYEMDQPAATLWYHDHRIDFTGPQVYRGLAGFHLIHDDAEEALGLPSGERDVPLMILDRSFAADGSFLYPSVDASLTGTPGVTEDYMSGVLGDCILVNGAPWPVLEVSTTKYRLRLLNASNARRYRLRLDGGPGLVQIGSDQGLLPAPVASTRSTSPRRNGSTWSWTSPPTGPATRSRWSTTTAPAAPHR